jgi:hypothetical protein
LPPTWNCLKHNQLKGKLYTFLTITHKIAYFTGIYRRPHFQLVLSFLFEPTEPSIHTQISQFHLDSDSGFKKLTIFMLKRRVYNCLLVEKPSNSSCFMVPQTVSLDSKNSLKIPFTLKSFLEQQNSHQHQPLHRGNQPTCKIVCKLFTCLCPSRSRANYLFL